MRPVLFVGHRDENSEGRELPRPGTAPNVHTDVSPVRGRIRDIRLAPRLTGAVSPLLRSWRTALSDGVPGHRRWPLITVLALSACGALDPDPSLERFADCDAMVDYMHDMALREGQYAFAVDL